MGMEERLDAVVGSTESVKGTYKIEEGRLGGAKVFAVTDRRAIVVEQDREEDVRVASMPLAQVVGTTIEIESDDSPGLLVFGGIVVVFLGVVVGMVGAAVMNAAALGGGILLILLGVAGVLAGGREEDASVSVEFEAADRESVNWVIEEEATEFVSTVSRVVGESHGG